MPLCYQIAIIGSGPAGLSAGGRAAFYDKEQRSKNPDHPASHILLESFDKPSKTIQRYQKGKHVMAEPGFLALRSDFDFAAGSREAVLGGWESRVEETEVNIRYNSEVVKVSGQKGNFCIVLKDGSEILAEHVVLAIGLEGNPRKLGVQGEDLPIVQYTLDDPGAHSDETIVVVGAGDSAIENALALVKQNKVAILNRRDEFSRAKEANLDAILAANTDASVPLTCYYGTGVKQLEEAEEGGYKITLKTPEGEVSLNCDRVIARLGGVPPRGFVESIGVEFPNKKPGALPALSGQYESNVEGLYIIGSLAGYPLIKQAMNQGYDVVEYILGHDIKPADHPLLEYQFKLLPYFKEVDDLVKLFQGRIPMFREMNALQFRELVIESDILVSYEAGPILDEVQGKSQEVAQLLAQQDPSPRFTKVIQAGDFIYRDGDFSNSFFTIIEGEVEVTLPDSSRSTVHSRGQFFGEASLLSGRPREGTAVAGKDCIIVETPRRTMVKLMNSNDEVREGIDLIFIVRALQKHVAPQLSIAKLSKFAITTQQRVFNAGEKLFTEGEEGDSLHIIRSGSITLSRNTLNNPVVVAQLHSGKIVGEMALMGDNIRRETAAATVFTETIELNKKAFLELIKADTSCVELLQNNASDRAVGHSTMEARPEVGSVMQFFMDEGLGEATNCLIINEELCVGCDNCETACAETHNGISRLDRKSGASYNDFHVPVSCRHCEQPHCMKDCPPNAIHRAPSGEVFIDSSCIGCGNCESNCPYDVIKLAYDAPKKPSVWNWLLFGSGAGPGEEAGYEPDAKAKAKGKKAVKCDACMSLPSGPACVNSCPTGAAIRVNPEQFIELVEVR